MSFILLGILNSAASGIAQAYFLSIIGGASAEAGNGITTDSANNIMAVGSTDSAGAGSSDFLIVKYDTLGVVQFQRVLGGASSDVATAVAVDLSDNSYVAGRTFSAGAGSIDFLTAKYDSSGTIQWQRLLGGAGADQAYAVVVDSVGDVYVVGQVNNTNMMIVKYNSSGTVQFQRQLGSATTQQAFGVAVDSSDNFYIVGESTFGPSSFQNWILAKYNSSGTIQFQKQLAGDNRDTPQGIALDSTGNIYVVGHTGSEGAGNRDFMLVKYDTAGDVVWQRILGGADNDFGYSVAIDSFDNIYVSGETGSAGAGGVDALIAKYDSSGTIVWQRVLGGTGTDRAKHLAIDSLDNVCIVGETDTTGAGGLDVLVARLPNDGSLTGTYSLDGNNIVYAASTLTAATSTLAESTSTLTASTPSLTAATSTLTDAASTLDTETVEL